MKVLFLILGYSREKKNDAVVYTALVLSLKSNGQLFGVLWEKVDGAERETISASDDGAVVMGNWDHVVWMPFSDQYFFNGVQSTHSTINGISLVDLNEYHPNGGSIKVGASFHGRISLLRIWNYEISNIQNYMDETISCDFADTLIAYYDFSYCKQNNIQDFIGQSCGTMNPSEDHFMWYNLDAPTSFGNEERYHTQCKLESSCNEECQIPNPLELVDGSRVEATTQDLEVKTPPNFLDLFGMFAKDSNNPTKKAQLANNIVAIFAIGGLVGILGFVFCFKQRKTSVASPTAEQV